MREKKIESYENPSIWRRFFSQMALTSKPLNSTFYILPPEADPPSEENPISRKGFTIVELLVAMGLFSIILTIAVGGAVGALRTQRQVIGLVSANGNLSLAIEQISREIRTGYNFSVDTTGGLAFKNSKGDTVCYYLDADYSIKRAVNDVPPCASGIAITSGNVGVKYLTFKEESIGQSAPPRITILLGVSSKEQEVRGSIVQIQTTVAAR